MSSHVLSHVIHAIPNVYSRPQVRGPSLANQLAGLAEQKARDVQRAAEDLMLCGKRSLGKIKHNGGGKHGGREEEATARGDELVVVVNRPPGSPEPTALFSKRSN